MNRYILDNQDHIATAACLDSGKTKVDASLGEILVTVEKLKWTIQHGKEALKPERRPTNFLMMYKYNEVRWEPLGVVVACVSWKYVQTLPNLICLQLTTNVLQLSSMETLGFGDMVILIYLTVSQFHGASHIDSFHRICHGCEGLRIYSLVYQVFCFDRPCSPHIVRPFP